MTSQQRALIVLSNMNPRMRQFGGDGPLEEIDEAAEEEAREKLRREREARAQALTLEIVGDLPFAEVKPPENVLFVCKLNPVTEGQKTCPAIPPSLLLIQSPQ